jgi:8-oxo-dGTP diphosphatase
MSFQKLSPEVLREHKSKSFPGITTVFFCHDGKGKVFLTKRSKNARDEHGKWDPGGGGLKQGVTLVDNVKREIQEEYGIASPKSIDFIGYRDVFRVQNGIDTHWLAMDFAVLVDPSEVRVCEPDLVDDSGWFTLDKLPQPLHSQFGIFLELHGNTLKELMNR